MLLVAIITTIGLFIGVICGWYGKKVDTVLMRISDMFLAFPGLVFALAVAAVMGGGLQNAIIALAAISWPKYARIARSQTLAQKETAFLKAARLSGSSTIKIIFKHILPNIIGPVLVSVRDKLASFKKQSEETKHDRPEPTKRRGMDIE